MILREYFPNRNVESSMEISDADSARYSSPFTETVHLPSRARRIFRSSNFIACDYSKNTLSLCERAARQPREPDRAKPQEKLAPGEGSGFGITSGFYRLRSTHSHWQIRRRARLVERSGPGSYRGPRGAIAREGRSRGSR